MKTFPHRQILAGAVMAALGVTSGMASADVSVYGRAHVSVDSLDNGEDSELNISSNSSRIGFRAGSDVTENLHAMVQIEQEILFDSSGSDFATRDTFVGIRGDLGMLRIGKFDTPLKRVRSAVDLFGDQVGDARNIVRSRTGAPGASSLDERYPNSIHYQTPSFGPMQFNVQYSTSTDGDDADSEADKDGLSVSATYTDGPLYAAIAHETKGDDVGDRSANRLGVRYDFDAFRVTGFYQAASNGDDAIEDDAAYGAGIRYRMGRNDLKAQYYIFDSDADDSDASMLALGVDHHVSSDLRFYVAYAMTSNDDSAAFVPYREARSAGTDRIAGEDAAGLSVGLRYDF